MMQGWTKQEAQFLRQDLQSMLFPEMVPQVINALGYKLPADDSNILELLSASKSRGLTLLDCLLSRSTQFADQLEQKPELNLILQSLNELKPPLRNLFTALPTEQHHLLNNIIESVFWAAFHAGSHDQRMLTQRHFNKGFQQNVINNRQAGLNNGARYEPMIILIREIVEYMQVQQSEIGKIHQSDLITAIYDLLYDFAAIGENKHLPALQQYIERIPSHHTIEKYLKAAGWRSSRNGRKLSVRKIKDILRSGFTNRKIKSILDKTMT